MKTPKIIVRPNHWYQWFWPSWWKIKGIMEVALNLPGFIESVELKARQKELDMYTYGHVFKIIDKGADSKDLQT